jgi:hypothetical protein
MNHAYDLAQEKFGLDLDDLPQETQDGLWAEAEELEHEAYYESGEYLEER